MIIARNGPSMLIASIALMMNTMNAQIPIRITAKKAINGIIPVELLFFFDMIKMSPF